MLDVPPVYQPHALESSFFCVQPSVTRAESGCGAQLASTRIRCERSQSVSRPALGGEDYGPGFVLCLWLFGEALSERPGEDKTPLAGSQSFNQGWSEASFFLQPELLVWETSSSPVPMRNRSGRCQRRRNENLFFLLCLTLITLQLVYLEKCAITESFSGGQQLYWETFKGIARPLKLFLAVGFLDPWEPGKYYVHLYYLVLIEETVVSFLI